MDGLGVTEEQAKGGAGMIFNLAKEKLGGDEFTTVQNAVPNITDMMSSASVRTKSESGLLGAVTSAIGGGGGTLGNLASLAGGFSDLKMDGDMIGKFLPIVIKFVQSKGGDTAKNLLEKVLK